MYLEELVEVAAGLILIFIVMSLASMQIQEVLAGLMRWRSKQLEKAIREMLVYPGEPPKFWQRVKARFQKTETTLGSSTWVVHKIYEHPLIRSLSQPGKRPSYIPANKFSVALFDTVITAGTDASVIRSSLECVKEKREQWMSDAVCQGIDALIKEAQEIGNDKARLGALHEKVDLFLRQYQHLEPLYNALLQTYIPKEGSEVMERIKDGAEVLIISNPDLRQAMESLISEAEVMVGKGELALAKTRQNVETWFDDTMDRASGWYKRNMQWVSLSLGFILALAFNVDAIQIANQLWKEPTLRQTLVAQAEKYQLPEDLAPQDFGQSINQVQSSITSLNLPLGWRFDAVSFDPLSQQCSLFGNNDRQSVRGFFIEGECKVWADPPRSWGIMNKFLGFLIIGVATMQGAPFWFDLLKKVVNIRSAGAKPASGSTTT